MYQIALSKNILGNGIIPKLIKKNGRPQCGIYTLGQLSKLYILIWLGETNKIVVKRGYYFFSLIPFDDKVVSFPNPEAFPFLSDLKSTGHHDTFGKLKITITDHNLKWDDTSRQERESFWITSSCHRTSGLHYSTDWSSFNPFNAGHL